MARWSSQSAIKTDHKRREADHGGIQLDASRARACHSSALSPLIFSAIGWDALHYIVHCDVQNVFVLGKHFSEHEHEHVKMNIVQVSK